MGRYYIICPHCGEVINTNVLVAYEHCPTCNQRYPICNARIVKGPAFDMFGIVGLIQMVFAGCIISRVFNGAAPAFDLVFGIGFIITSGICTYMSEHCRTHFETMLRRLCLKTKKKD